MPLIQSGSREAISRNISEMVHSGRPHDQAVAAALRTADQFGKRAAGGSAPAAPTAPTYKTVDSGINSSGFMPVSTTGGMGIYKTGDWGLDQKTGAITPDTQQILGQFSSRGMPGGVNIYNQLHPQAAAPAATGPDPALAAAVNNFQLGSNGDTGNRGGRLPRLASGGMPSQPWFVRSEAAHMAGHPSGLIHTAGPGRTDNVPMSVASGSHVIPADVVAGLGQGNNLAGALALGEAMKGGPGGIKLPHSPVKSTIPKPPAVGKMGGFAMGGMPMTQSDGARRMDNLRDYEDAGQPIKVARGGCPGGVKCILAGGEWLMAPHEVEAATHNGKRGHEAVDAWIMERRKEDIAKLRKLRPPVGMKH